MKGNELTKDLSMPSGGSILLTDAVRRERYLARSDLMELIEAQRKETTPALIYTKDELKMHGLNIGAFVLANTEIMRPDQIRVKVSYFGVSGNRIRMQTEATMVNFMHDYELRLEKCECEGSMGLERDELRMLGRGLRSEQALNSAKDITDTLARNMELALSSETKAGTEKVQYIFIASMTTMQMRSAPRTGFEQTFYFAMMPNGLGGRLALGCDTL